MPEINVFHWSYSFVLLSNSNAHGISFIAKGDRAEINYLEQNGTLVKDKIRAYNLDKLSKTKLFRGATEIGTETLVNTWHSMRSKEGRLIKYATNNNLAFVISSSNNDAEKRFFKLDFKNIDYFKEHLFVAFLNSRNTSVAELRTVPGMDENRINLLVNNLGSFETLLELGFDFKQIAQIKPSVIESKSSRQLSKALNYLTIEQIMGLNHFPKPARHVTLSYSPSYCGRNGWVKTFNGETITHKHSDTRLDVAYSKKLFQLTTRFSTLTAQFEFPSDERKRELDSQISNLQPEKLAFDWYHIQENTTSGKIERVLYCPAINRVMVENKHINFPEKNKSVASTSMASSLYYREKIFQEFLLKNGSSFDKLRAMQGMTNYKIHAMCTNQYAVSELLKKGIQLEDFANIRERRLAYVLTGLSKGFDVDCALKYVDARELLGLNQNLLSQSGFFKTKSDSGRLSQEHEKVAVSTASSSNTH